ncbi:hypothetical protein HPG69_006322 [Diceros bicornis minor]|uniref:Uncharacterized protein n=1 Tax=Diceros bicornis minor TaxID=77932 RepID=A0A7J7EPQ8_DICBM|nr:hypothetical protein HPG69_006322 [Diceros bicornis minor]
MARPDGHFPAQSSGAKTSQAEAHTRGSHPHGCGQSLGSSLQCNSPHDSCFCFEEPPVLCRV